MRAVAATKGFGQGSAAPRRARQGLVVAARAVATTASDTGAATTAPAKLAAAAAAALLLISAAAAPEPAFAANDLVAKRNAIREQVLEAEGAKNAAGKKGGLFGGGGGGGAKKAPALQARPAAPARPRLTDRSRPMISSGSAKQSAAATGASAAALPSPAVGAGVLALALAAAGRAAGKAAATPSSKPRAAAATSSAAPAAPPPKPKAAAPKKAPALSAAAGPTGTRRVPTKAAAANKGKAGTTAKAGTVTAGTVALRQAVRQAVVNEQNPDEPTVLTTGGVVGAALAVGALLVSSALQDASPPPAPVPAVERAPEIVRVATAGKEVVAGGAAPSEAFGFKRSGPSPEPAPPVKAATVAKKAASSSGSGGGGGGLFGGSSGSSSSTTTTTKAAAPAAAKDGEQQPSQLAAVGAGVAVLALALATLGTGGSSSSGEAAAAPSPSAGDASSPAAATPVDPAKLRAVFVALMSDAQSRNLMRDLLSGAGLAFDEKEFERQVGDAAAFEASIAPVLRRMPADKLRVLSDLAAKSSDVSGLVASVGDIAPMAKELSGDVKQTIETIRASSTKGGRGQ
jgi:hypothetical protein